MWDVLAIAGLLVLGALLAVIAGAVFSAAIFWAQNGDDDDRL